MKETTLVFNTLTWSGVSSIPGVEKNITEDSGFLFTYNPADKEEVALKLTLSALKPNVKIKVFINNTENVYLANSAGVFEKRFIIPVGQKISLEEIK